METVAEAAARQTVAMMSRLLRLGRLAGRAVLGAQFERLQEMRALVQRQMVYFLHDCPCVR